jgi:hypothetical protein
MTAKGRRNARSDMAGTFLPFFTCPWTNAPLVFLDVQAPLVCLYVGARLRQAHGWCQCAKVK